MAKGHIGSAPILIRLPSAVSARSFADSPWPKVTSSTLLGAVLHPLPNCSV